MSSPDLQAAKRALREHRRELLARDGVHGVGVAPDRSTEGADGGFVIEVYVEPTVSPDLPTSVDGVPVRARRQSMPRATPGSAPPAS